MKIGIITYHRALNYGAVLQTYALQQFLKSLNIDCDVIDYKCPYIDNFYKPIKANPIKESKTFLKESVFYPLNSKKRNRFNCFINKFIKLLSKYKDKNIYVTSFNGKLMEKICRMTPTFKTGVLNYILNSTEMNCLDFICILDTLLDDKIINTLIKNGKEIFSYGIINNKKIGLYDDVNYIVD